VFIDVSGAPQFVTVTVSVQATSLAAAAPQNVGGEDVFPKGAVILLIVLGTIGRNFSRSLRNMNVTDAGLLKQVWQLS
jgi:hypothetical protein